MEWYSPNKLLSYNRVLHLCTGERGIGKSYAFKKFPIDQFKKNGTQFFYIRRYKGELKRIKNYFEDIKEIYPNDKLVVKGWTFYCNDEIMGYAMPLSQYQELKSNAFPKCDIIIFDEFLREKVGSVGYLKDEVNIFMSLCDTIFRKRKGTRAFLLSNSISVVNPYYLEFSITVERGKQYTLPNDPIYRDFVVSEFTDGMYKQDYEEMSPFQQMASHMEYGKMSQDNEFMNDDETFLCVRTKESKFVFSYKYKGRVYGVWSDEERGLLYVSYKNDPTTKHIYSMTATDHSENLQYMKDWKNNYHLSKLVLAFKKGYLRFDDQTIKTNGYDMFKRMNIY